MTISPMGSYPSYQQLYRWEDEDEKEANHNDVADNRHTNNEMRKEMDVYDMLIKLQHMELHMLQEAITKNPFFIEAKDVQKILALTKLTIHQFLQKLIPVIKEYALAPISNYKVGIVGLGASQNVYLGVNVEFFGFPLNYSIHGEQFLIANARNHGETKITAVALSAAPCGHCRQFLNEIADDHMQILLPDTPPCTLSQLLPHAFGPEDLGVKGGLLTRSPQISIHSQHPVPLIARAIEAAYNSYAPYSQAIAGVAIKTKDGSIHCGSYLENVAFNPSLSPLHVALVALIAARSKYSEIAEVVLVEQEGSKVHHALLSKSMLQEIAPQAKFHVEILPGRAKM